MLTKKGLAEKLYQNPRLLLKHKRDAQEIVDTLCQEIILAVEQREKIRLDGIGTFAVKHCKSRQGRNLHTGEIVTIPEKERVKFTPAKSLLDR